MTIAVFAERPIPAGRRSLAGWDRFGLRWVGWNGEEFDLRNIDAGLFVTNEGLLGLHNPAWETYVSESPATDGRRRTGSRVLPRSVLLHVYLSADDGSVEWANLYQRFFGSFHRDHPGRLIVSTPAGERELLCYADSGGDVSFTRDPLYEGRMRFAVPLTAEDPWWLGAEVERSWEQVEQTPFFGSDGNLHISSGATLGSASLVNPGDAPAWAQWEIRAEPDGPITVAITVDDGELGIPTVPAGGVLVIDTDPAVQLALLDETTDVTDTIDPWDQGPIPERDRVPVLLTMAGLGRVTVRFRPRFLRWL